MSEGPGAARRAPRRRRRCRRSRRRQPRSARARRRGSSPPARASRRHRGLEQVEEPGRDAPWSSSTPAGVPTTSSRETRRSRPPTTCRDQSSAAASSAASTYPAGRRGCRRHSPLASPFHAATTLSSRAGRSRARGPPAAGGARRPSAPGRRVPGGAAASGAALEGTAVGHGQEIGPNCRPPDRGTSVSWAGVQT